MFQTLLLPLLITLAGGSPLAVQSSEDELSAEARAYLERALDAMEADSLVRDSIDWPELRDEVFARAAGAKKTSETWEALEYAVEALGDGHSFLTTPGGSNAWVENALDSFTEPEGRWLEEGFGYVNVPGYLGIDPAEDLPFALTLTDIIAELDALEPKGWIVDLRRDTGGNMWPMLAGIGPILGDGIAGSFVGPDGRHSRWFHRNGTAGVGENVFFDLGDQAYRLSAPNPVVAVLTSGETASSGEAIAVAFRGRPRTRSFGSGTAGVSSANDTVWLGDGAMLFLCVANDADRTGEVYGGVIEPDEHVVSPEGPGEKDAVLDAAVAWLQSVTSGTAPRMMRTTETRYAAAVDAQGRLTQGPLERRFSEVFDARGRRLRWEQRGPDDERQVLWMGQYVGDDGHPTTAAYWTGEQSRPSTELFVTSDDGRFQDVLYADPGEKQRREARRYLDAHGREVMQEYFAPGERDPYSVELFGYDASGNETGREWRRLDGRASKVTRFEILDVDAHGRWTRRCVRIDGKDVFIDQRIIESGTDVASVPPASAGPCEASGEILPIPFEPGVITTRRHGENGLTFAPDGAALFTRHGDDWTDQTAWLSRPVHGVWQEPEPFPFVASLYHAAFSTDGSQIVFCQREDSAEGARVSRLQRTDSGWTEPLDLTARDGLRGSYFCLLANGVLYFHRDGDLHRCVVGPDASTAPESLSAPVNTPDGVEFGAWVDGDERRILFTRHVEGDSEASGLFLSERDGAAWGQPRRLPLPYGWSPTLSPDGEDLVYVVDGDICRVPWSWLEL